MQQFKKYDKYKDSGLAWLGDVPSGWEVKRWKDVVSSNRMSIGENYPSQKIINYIDISSVNSNGDILNIEPITFSESPSRARRVTKKNDVIISTVRTYLRAISFINFDAIDLICSTGFAVLTPRLIIFPKFLKYGSISDLNIFQISVNSKGISYPAINVSDLNSLFVSLPHSKPKSKLQSFWTHKLPPLTQR